MVEKIVRLKWIYHILALVLITLLIFYVNEAFSLFIMISAFFITLKIGLKTNTDKDVED